MFGAGALEWSGDLEVGATAERTSAVLSARTTAGGSGALLIVGLEHEYRQAGTLRLVPERGLKHFEFRGPAETVSHHFNRSKRSRIT